MSRVRKYIIKKGSKHLISKFQTIHSSKFLVNKQKGNKGYNDDFMPTLVLRQQHVTHVVTFWTHTQTLIILTDMLICIAHLDSSKRLRSGHADRYKKVNSRWNFYWYWFPCKFISFRVRILSEKKRTVSKFSDEVVLLAWFRPNAFAYSLW